MSNRRTLALTMTAAATSAVMIALSGRSPVASQPPTPPFPTIMPTQTIPAPPSDIPTPAPDTPSPTVTASPTDTALPPSTETPQPTETPIPVHSYLPRASNGPELPEPQLAIGGTNRVPR